MRGAYSVRICRQMARKGRVELRIVGGRLSEAAFWWETSVFWATMVTALLVGVCRWW